MQQDPNYCRHKSIMRRCHQPGHKDYGHYGARGIHVYGPWHDPGAFCDWIAANLGPCPPGYSIDRIDNDRGYEPGNLRWATPVEQTANRRRDHVELTCAVCSVSFRAGRSNALYCSRPCRRTAETRRALARRVANRGARNRSGGS